MPTIIKKFTRALRGLWRVFTAETSIRTHLFIAAAVVALAAAFEITRSEFTILLLVILWVITLEGINSMLERVIDLVEPRYKEMVRDTKDALAGLVLFASLGAAVIGAIIFYPYITGVIFSAV